MATKEQITDAILRVAGNPSSGTIRALAPQMAEEIVRIDHPVGKDKKKNDSQVVGVKETRVIEPDEVR